MPDSPFDWVMFAFFFGGAGGGWLVIVLFLIDVIRHRRPRRSRA